MLKCEMSRLEKKACISAVGTAEDLLVELAAVVSEVTRVLLRPSDDESEISRQKQIIIGSLFGGVEHGTDGFRKDMEAKKNDSAGC